MPDSVNHRPLPALRAMIDAVDRDILQLLERRNGIVAEVASYKRENRVAIRDFTREREIIEDRRGRAAKLGLSSDVIESMWRLVLWASRDRQAALKAEVPPDVKEKTVAIIGGAGQMGRCMAQLFGDLGHAVMIADLETQLTAKQAAAVADVVIISVPIRMTCAVIEEIGPVVRDDALLMDVTSVKTEPMEAMLASSGASVVGTHPLFGPSVHSVQGQRVVLTPGRGEAWLDWLRQMLTARGLNLIETTPQAHDRTMSVVQVLTHFATEVLGVALSRIGIPLEQTLEFTSPVYLMELLMTGRHFAQSSDLYASIEMTNPQRKDVVDAFLAATQELSRIVVDQDRDAFKAMFEEVGTYFGDFTDRALEQSSFMIDRLVERS